jgi:N-methylhydantoinase B/oxoprolinase/acetone carboxylase alpha subunit
MQKRAKVIHQGHEKIYQRVDEFYANKLVPNGYVLSNYADLKAEVAANKENVALLLEAAQTSGKDFDCESDDPKGQVDAFQEDMKALIDANKKYKDSIYAFVRAVRDLAKTAKLDKISLTPSQSPTPTVEVAQ